MKTILITGSTDGVGKLTAMKLAKSGHQMLFLLLDVSTGHNSV